ncbi:MAG: hypothetical protein R3A80_13310 [Bdellovibrionota bacterium]
MVFRLQKITKKLTQSLILTTCLFSASAFAANANDEWVTVSLSQEDSEGANALIALVRNMDRFSAWLNDEELGPTTQIMVKRPANNPEAKVTTNSVDVVDPVSGEKSRKIVKTSRQVTSLRYIVTERDARDPSILKRVLIVKEEMITEFEVGKESQAKVTYNYPALNVAGENLASASSEAYRAAADQLWSLDGPDCIDFAGGSEICRIKDAATKLIRAASRKSKLLAEKIAQAKASKRVVLDTQSRKSVTFEENTATGAVRNVVLSGFIKSPTEKLLAPDSASAWVVKIDVGGKFSVEERKVSEADQVDISSLKFK